MKCDKEMTKSEPAPSFGVIIRSKKKLKHHKMDTVLNVENVIKLGIPLDQLIKK